MNKLFISQNRGGGLFQYMTINVIVDDFGGQRADGYEGTLLATPNTWEAKLCLISQDGMVTREELLLDEGMYSDLLPVSYPPYVYTGHQSWGQNANYYLAKEEGDPCILQPGLATFVFTALCGFEIDGVEVLGMDNIGRVNVSIRNIDTDETLTYTDIDCAIAMSSSWEFVVAISLPKWQNMEIHFETFSAEIRI